MCWSSLSLLGITCCVLLEFHQAYAGVTLLLESPESPTNSSHLLTKVSEAARYENERISEKILLTKDKDVKDAWRTEKGDLVELYAPSLEKKTSIQRNFQVANSNDKIMGETVVLPGPVIPINPANRNVADNFPGTSPSHRMKRTFWPFTSLFGYDYDYPPYGNYGMFGPPMRPPFGGGGFGMGYPSPYGPPPPLFGFEFGFGL